MSDLINRADAIEAVRKKLQDWGSYAFEDYRRGLYEAQDIIEALPSADAVHGEWISEIDTGTWMLKCSVCGCRVQEEKYRIAVGENATKCPYCGAELGLGGYLYDEYANRPSERKGGDDE